jgi:hypothetical protein
MVGRLGCTTGGEGEVGSNKSRIHLGEEERRSTVRGRGRGVLIVEGSDTKLRIIRRFNLLVSQPFLSLSIYVCVCVWRAIYNSNGLKITT